MGLPVHHVTLQARVVKINGQPAYLISVKKPSGRDGEFAVPDVHKSLLLWFGWGVHSEIIVFEKEKTAWRYATVRV